MTTIAFNTIVLVTATRAWRADLAVGGEVQGLWGNSRRTGSTLAESVRAALTLGGSSGRTVLVLGTDVWTQTLSLHPGQVAGLSKADLAKALAFEVEPFSGIPTLDSVVGTCESGTRDGTAGFRITQMQRQERDAVQRAIKDSGSKLAGICHPGGLPVPLGTRKGGEAWRRVEFWDGALVMVSSDDGRLVQTRVLSSFPDARQIPAHGSFEILNAHAGATPPREAGIDWQMQELSDEKVLRTWLAAWRSSLQRDTSHAPLIAPEAAPPSSSRFIVLGGATLGAAVVACLLQTGWYGNEMATLKAEHDEHARMQQLIEGTQKQNVVLKKELEDARKQQHLRERVDQQRRALPLLLNELAARRTQDIVVRSIKPEQNTMIVGGLALEATAVDELGIVLSQFLRPVGLVAQPLEKKARRALADDGPWDFTLSIKPVELLNKTIAPQAALTESN